MKTIYALAAAALLSLTACSSEDVAEQQGGGQEPAKDDLVQVRLRISPASSTSSNTRALWVDTWAEDNEMMNLWTVVIVNDATDKVVEVQSCRPSSSYAEIDDVSNLPAGTYRFYSFANISAANVASLLGIPAAAVPVIDAESKDAIDKINSENFSQTDQTQVDMGTVRSGDPTAGGNDGGGISSKLATVNGNGFNPEDPNNGFDEKGIPMCNVQKYTIASSGTYDLIVIRMLAKIELRLFNVTGKDIKVKSITFSGLTKNETNNLFLLPGLTNTSGNTPNEIAYTHKDIYPRVASANRDNFVKSFTTDLTVSKDYNDATYEKATGKYESVVFYVNESRSPDNPDGLFNITLELENDDYRYALINQKGSTTADNDAWNYIARNDYRIIPIVLDGYRLEMIPYDFPEIGVYPASVYVTNPSERISKQIYQMDFHDYGHFHLLPHVKRYYTEDATDKTDEVSFSATKVGTGTYWTLNGANTSATESDWSNSFKSYTDETATTEYTLEQNSSTTKFYGTPGPSGLPSANVYPSVLPAYLTAKDNSENGDWPVFYMPGTGDPYWVPDPITMTTPIPYIFGQIAPQEANVDKKVFHEFKVNLYVDGSTTPRILTYRFYMHLKQDHAAARCH